MNGRMTKRILNVGLDLAMTSCKGCLQPIQSRLSRRYPALSPAELDACNEVCQEAMLFGHQQVLLTVPQPGSSRAAHIRLFRAAVLEKYSWITVKNMGRLFSRGCFYAMK